MWHMEHWAWARWFKVWQVCMDRDGEGWMTGELEPREVDSRDWCQRSNGRLYKEGIQGMGYGPLVTKGTPWRGLWGQMIAGTSDVGDKVQYNWRSQRSWGSWKDDRLWGGCLKMERYPFYSYQ